MTFTLTLDPNELDGTAWKRQFIVRAYQDDDTRDAWHAVPGADGALWDGAPISPELDPATGLYAVMLPDQTVLPAGFEARVAYGTVWTYIPAYPDGTTVPFTRFLTRPVKPPLNPDYLSRLADIEARLGDLENFSIVQEPDGATVITRGDTEVDGGGPRTTYDARHIIDGGRP